MVLDQRPGESLCFVDDAESQNNTAGRTFADSLETPQAQQGVVGHRLDLVPLQVEVSQVLHPSEGSGDPPEVVLEAEHLLQRRRIDEDAVGDVEEVAVGHVQARQLLDPSERPRVKVTDVVVVRYFQLH